MARIQVSPGFDVEVNTEADIGLVEANLSYLRDHGSYLVQMGGLVGSSPSDVYHVNGFGKELIRAGAKPSYELRLETDD